MRQTHIPRFATAAGSFLAGVLAGILGVSVLSSGIPFLGNLKHGEIVLWNAGSGSPVPSKFLYATVLVGEHQDKPVDIKDRLILNTHNELFGPNRIVVYDSSGHASYFAPVDFSFDICSASAGRHISNLNKTIQDWENDTDMDSVGLHITVQSSSAEVSLKVVRKNGGYEIYRYLLLEKGPSPLE